MNTPTAAGLTAEVRAEMARQGISAAKVATATNINPATLSRRLNGTSDFTVGEVSRVAQFLGVTLADLLRRAETIAA